LDELIGKFGESATDGSGSAQYQLVRTVEPEYGENYVAKEAGALLKK